VNILQPLYFVSTRGEKIPEVHARLSSEFFGNFSSQRRASFPAWRSAVMIEDDAVSVVSDFEFPKNGIDEERLALTRL
jgi:hypothetical protein